MLDIHVHIAGRGHGATGCFLSEKMMSRFGFRVMRRAMGITDAILENDLDGFLKRRLFSDLDGCPDLRHAVVLAYDAIYTDQGEEDARTGMKVPNDFVLQLTREHPKILFGASIHPARVDALDELDRVCDEGAVLLKWLPSNQVIDPRKKNFQAFIRKLADKNLPVLAHTGSEYVMDNWDDSLNHPGVLVPLLEQGVRVIAAHCATHSMPFAVDAVDDFIVLLKKYPHFFGDISALAGPRGWGMARRLADAGVMDRLIYGSDYPVPSDVVAFLLRGDIGFKETKAIGKISNYFSRDRAIKQALGYPAPLFDAAEKILKIPT